MCDGIYEWCGVEWGGVRGGAKGEVGEARRASDARVERNYVGDV